MAGWSSLTVNVAREHNVLDLMETKLGVDPYRAPFEVLSRAVQRLDDKERESLVLESRRYLENPDVRRSEILRVGTVKTLVALLPMSADVIRSWVCTMEGDYVNEVHFTLFCFLDQVPALADAEEFAAEVPSMIEEYLLRIKTESAHAAWMAGDLMGDHWKTSESLPVLVRAAKEARYVAGRKGALHGIARALENAQDSERDRVARLIQTIANEDRSREVKEQAKFVLRHFRAA